MGLPSEAKREKEKPPATNGTSFGSPISPPLTGSGVSTTWSAAPPRQGKHNPIPTRLQHFAGQSQAATPTRAPPSLSFDQRASSQATRRQAAFLCEPRTAPPAAPEPEGREGGKAGTTMGETAESRLRGIRRAEGKEGKQH